MFTSEYKLSAITQVESGETLSSDDFRKKIEERTLYLKEKYQIKEGTSVLLLHNNTIKFFIDLFAVINLKATAVPLDSNSSTFEIDKVKKHAEISLTLTETEEIPSEYRLTKLAGKAFVLYTSGTSGDPKGIVINYEAFTNKITVNKSRFSNEELKRPFCILPTFFGMGLFSNCLFAILNGEHTENFYIAKKCDLLLASQFSKVLEKYKITFFNSVLSNWDLILNFCPVPQNNELIHLKRVQYGSNLFTPEKVNAIKKWLGKNVALYDVYGLTEMSGSVCVSKVTDESPGNVFTDFWSLDYKIGEHNELLLKSNYMFDGYHNNPAANEAAFTSDGYFRTGDVFSDHSIKGRIKNVIMKHDNKIYPQEIDNFLMNSNLVTDCYSFPMKDSFSGERLGAIICLSPGVTQAEVREYCLKNLSHSKIPDTFFVQEKIERNSRGKISLQALTKIIENK